MRTHDHVHSLFPGFGTIRRELEQAFNDVYSGTPQQAAGARVPVSIWQDDRRVVVELDVPGFRQSDLNLRFEDGRLVISGERSWPQEGRQIDYNERRFGRFERVVALSDSVDPSSIDAALADGVLTVTFNKKVEAVPQPVRIRYAGQSMDETADSE